MKIAFMGQKRIPAFSSQMEKHVENLALRLSEMGHEIFVYVQSDYTSKKIDSYKGIKLVHIPRIFPGKIDILSYHFLATIHSLAKNYDIVHYHSVGSSLFCFIPKILKRKTAIISTLHYRPNLKSTKSWFVRKLFEFAEKMSCKIPDANIVLKKTLRSYIFNKYGTRASFVRNGEEIKYDSGTKVLERWNLKDKKYILVSGDELNDDSAEFILNSFKKLEKTNKIPNGFKLVVIGKIEAKKNDELKKTEENIIFTESQSGSTLEQLFSHAYLFIQMTKQNSSASFLLDAMSYGLSTLVSNFSDNLETIGKCGFSFYSRSRQDFEEKLAYLLNKPEEIKRMGLAAKERIRKEYSWDEAARKTLRIYELNKRSINNLNFRKINAENKSYV